MGEATVVFLSIMRGACPRRTAKPIYFYEHRLNASDKYSNPRHMIFRTIGPDIFVTQKEFQFILIIVLSSYT
jgi:hypothetical protein